MLVMAGLVPAIHVLAAGTDVDARPKAGHDGDYCSGDAAFEAGLDPLLRQVAADEYDPAFPLLPIFPWPLVIAGEDHVHALKHEPLVVALELQDALAAQDVGAVPLHQVLHPGEEPVGIE